MKAILIPPAVQKILSGYWENSVPSAAKKNRKTLASDGYYDHNRPNYIDESEWELAKAVIKVRQAQRKARDIANAARTAAKDSAKVRNKEIKEKKIETIIHEQTSDRVDVILKESAGCNGRKDLYVQPDWIKSVFDKGLAFVEAEKKMCLVLWVDSKKLWSQVDMWKAKVAVPTEARYDKRWEAQDGILARFNGVLAFGKNERTVLQRLRAKFKHEHQLVYETARLSIK